MPLVQNTFNELTEDGKHRIRGIHSSVPYSYFMQKILLLSLKIFDI